MTRADAVDGASSSRSTVPFAATRTSPAFRVTVLDLPSACVILNVPPVTYVRTVRYRPDGAGPGLSGVMVASHTDTRSLSMNGFAPTEEPPGGALCENSPTR